MEGKELALRPPREHTFPEFAENVSSRSAEDGCVSQLFHRIPCTLNRNGPFLNVFLEYDTVCEL